MLLDLSVSILAYFFLNYHKNVLRTRAIFSISADPKFINPISSRNEDDDKKKFISIIFVVVVVVDASIPYG